MCSLCLTEVLNSYSRNDVLCLSCLGGIFAVRVELCAVLRLQMMPELADLNLAQIHLRESAFAARTLLSSGQPGV